MMHADVRSNLLADEPYSDGRSGTPRLTDPLPIQLVQLEADGERKQKRDMDELPRSTDSGTGEATINPRCEEGP